jgi:hypothetical protein
MSFLAANTAAITPQLKVISEAVPAGRHAVLLLDRTGWHTTGKRPFIGQPLL